MPTRWAPPIYWLLPRQATFSAERELTCGSGLPGFCRAHVVSFEQFGREIFDDCGGSCIPQVTPLGRQMVVGHLLRQLHPRLRFFASVARQPGLAGELDATLDELQRSGAAPRTLPPCWNSFGATPAMMPKPLRLSRSSTICTCSTTPTARFWGRSGSISSAGSSR